MGRYLVRRLALSILAFLGVLVVMFMILQLAPVDPARQYAGPKASFEDVERIRVEKGFDKSMPVQLYRYIADFVKGDWGESLATKRPVIEDMAKTLPYTLELVILTELFVIGIGIPLGILSAAKKDGLLDHASRLFSISLVSIPTFWLALGLQYLVSGQLELFPLSGNLTYQNQVANPIEIVIGFPLIDALVTGNTVAFWDHLGHIVLPVIALAGMALAAVTRLTRAGMAENLNEDYIVAARSYGLPERNVLWRHGLKNSMGPIASIVALMFGYMLVNTFLVESIFAWPGMGEYMTKAVAELDYPVIMGVTLVSAITFLVVNFLADIVIATDPRVRAR